MVVQIGTMWCPESCSLEPSGHIQSYPMVRHVPDRPFTVIGRITGCTGSLVLSDTLVPPDHGHDRNLTAT